jgi:hypothetical protein
MAQNISTYCISNQLHLRHSSDWISHRKILKDYFAYFLNGAKKIVSTSNLPLENKAQIIDKLSRCILLAPYPLSCGHHNPHMPCLCLSPEYFQMIARKKIKSDLSDLIKKMPTEVKGNLQNHFDKSFYPTEYYTKKIQTNAYLLTAIGVAAFAIWLLRK